MDKQQAVANTTSMLSATLEEAVSNDYMAKYKVIAKGLTLEDELIIYKPEEVTISRFYCFHDPDHPDDSVILFLIETHDGNKGTLMDCYGVHADAIITDFIQQVKAKQNLIF